MSTDSGNPNGDIIDRDDMILSYKGYRVMYRPDSGPYGASITDPLKLKSYVRGNCALEVLGKAWARIEEETAPEPVVEEEPESDKGPIMLRLNKSARVAFISSKGGIDYHGPIVPVALARHLVKVANSVNPGLQTWFETCLSVEDAIAFLNRQGYSFDESSPLLAIQHALMIYENHLPQ